MRSKLKKYLTKRLYHYLLVIGIVFLAYPIYDLYNSINDIVLFNSQYTSLIDIFFLSIEISFIKLLIYSLVVIAFGIIIMNYARNGFNEKVYHSNQIDRDNIN